MMRNDESKARIIAHVDLDYFFAQIEERENPIFKDKPVVVCVYSGRSEDSGAVSTANYIARSFGVKAGMPIIFAKNILKDKEAIFIRINKEFYKKVSEEIMMILRGNADKFEQESIDEASLDITERVGNNYKQAETFAKELKQEILDKERLTCSIGVAPNKLIAKMASSYKKPNGLTIIKTEEIKSFLSPLPIGKLYGVGEKTEKTLQELGIKTIGDLAQYKPEELIKIFGIKLGTYFHNGANGIDETPVQERNTVQISRIITLKEDSRDQNLINKEMNNLCEIVQRITLDEGFKFRSISLMIVAENMSIHSRSKTLSSPTNDLKLLRDVSNELLQRFFKESELRVRRIGVRVSDLTSASTQKPLSSFI